MNYRDSTALIMYSETPNEAIAGNRIITFGYTVLRLYYATFKWQVLANAGA